MLTHLQCIEYMNIHFRYGNVEYLSVCESYLPAEKKFPLNPVIEKSGKGNRKTCELNYLKT